MSRHFSDSFTSSLDTQGSISVSTSIYHKSIKDDVVKTVHYGMYSGRKRKATVKWLTVVLNWVSVIVKRTAVQDITQFTLVIADVAGCASFVKINISKQQKVEMDALNVMRKLRLPMKIEQCTSHLHTSTIK